MTYNRYQGPQPGSIGRSIIDLLRKRPPMTIRDISEATGTPYDSARATILKLKKTGFLLKINNTTPQFYTASEKNPDVLKIHEETVDQDNEAWNDKEHQEWMARYTQRREQRMKIQQGVNP